MDSLQAKLCFHAHALGDMGIQLRGGQKIETHVWIHHAWVQWLSRKLEYVLGTYTYTFNSVE